MGLNSTVVTLNNFFKLNFSEEFQTFLGSPKEFFSIPDYQREYKWEKPKIKTFVSNVMQKSKFLGIVTTEVSGQSYLSIVDGQQRLTTIMLMLAWLYNECAIKGETETQREILDLISYEHEGQRRFKLENKSVGDYLHLSTNDAGTQIIDLKIDPSVDIFKQARQFSSAWDIIDTVASDICKKNPEITLDSYKQMLLDCEILLFSQKSANGLQQGSIEEIYIDINEKSQKLDPEDIFKGHCFAICKAASQQEKVKKLWRSVKENFFSMEHAFKQGSMDMFLHHYLLTQEAIQRPREDIKTDLTIDGDNIITKRYNTPTKVINLITDISKYQENLSKFQKSLSSIRPEFPDIMTATAQELGNYSDRLIEMQSILSDIFSCKQNLFKLPLFYLIDSNMKKPSAEKLSYAQLSGFVYLYYVYMFLFARINSSRKRDDLANDLIDRIHSGQNFLLQFIKEIKSYASGLNLELDEKVFRDKFAQKHLYQILDYFHAESSTGPAVGDSDFSFKLRLFPKTYNVEHLIVHKSHSIVWTSEHYNESNPPANTRHEFELVDFRTCQAWIRPNNHWANFIWIDETFNREQLGNKDIISKLILLRGHCKKDDTPSDNTYAKKHTHIEMICQRIMDTPGFDELYQAYQSDAPRDVVLNRYQTFIDHYFSEERTSALRHDFSGSLGDILNSLYALIR